MLTDPAPSSAPDLSDELGEMRAAIMAKGARRGLAGKLQAALLRLLEVLAAMLADFRAGRLAPSAPGAGRRERAGDDAGAAGGKGAAAPGRSAHGCAVGGV
jgi:hypothetical protein